MKRVLMMVLDAIRGRVEKIQITALPDPVCRKIVLHNFQGKTEIAATTANSDG